MAGFFLRNAKNVVWKILGEETAIWDLVMDGGILVKRLLVIYGNKMSTGLTGSGIVGICEEVNKMSDFPLKQGCSWIVK